MTAAEAIDAARRAGVVVTVDAGDLVLKAPVRPPSAVIVALAEHKAGILEILTPDDTTPVARPRHDSAARSGDDDHYLAHLLKHGPRSYGALAYELHWTPSRAWRAEEALRTAGRIIHDKAGRSVPASTSP